MRSGTDRPAYASAETRAAEIEVGAVRKPVDLLADLADSAMALRTVARQLPDAGWIAEVQILDSPRFPAAQLLTRRLVEVELHHTDLGAEYRLVDWPPAFAVLELAEPMQSQRRDRLSRPPSA